MADVRESFPTTENGSGVGVPLTSVLEGDAAAAKNASPSLVAKDNSNNLIYLRTNAAGSLSVDINDGSTAKTARGTVAGNAAITTVCSIALVAGKTYHTLSWVTSCFRDAIYELVAIDDPAGTPTEVILADVLVGAGDFTDSGTLENATFVAGATAPVLRLRAKNLNNTSDFRGTISIREEA